jgi:histidine triad (HIT) family protein
MEDCIFCKIIRDEIPRDLIFEDSEAVVFKSNRPAAEHHLLVVPKKHIGTFMELDNVILSMTKVAQGIIKKLNLSDGYKMIFNGGKYQEVPHVHWHILSGKLEDSDDILNKI